jgi:hypothetical protein
VPSILVTNRSFFLRLMREMGLARQASTTHSAINKPLYLKALAHYRDETNGEMEGRLPPPVKPE